MRLRKRTAQKGHGATSESSPSTEDRTHTDGFLTLVCCVRLGCKEPHHGYSRSFHWAAMFGWGQVIFKNPTTQKC